ncbi:Predicted transmembrane transcriptional regulator (anti-sigma factor) [Serratia entomophila]|uniref:anti-sigma factor family protein n=1 Tax=Serratia entomophila TaxID=42906 RepID=UPI0021786670|nr:anti-sigma factor [Serratia entomophila]CAI1013194.1 Predicted transmembrane transcriptional regulator (anti-sigma factor) [Serratia entomophila]CAI1033569.1 Predicted transmembrane transcriptional regulator (anti-sigma factor) [Serratia entomophila]CAI1043700.1 Predicted transmembrane transcriptional regulator (anti-sigma factor) [Serratia entomophila]CAI1863134.1 Predicted transmembrane transcriptional regulator (anti-sigma factor) [Serratia entomophila]CAI1871477.1 Predicted transmembran
MTPYSVTDELLVAYLDNQLEPQQRQDLDRRLAEEPALAERLTLLARSSLPFKQAFAPLLDEAPIERLRAGWEQPRSTGVSRRGLIAAAVGFLALGAAADRAYLLIGRPEENWRSLVAQYMALYTPETLADIDTTPQNIGNQLQHTGDRLGIALPQERLLLGGATLKNARLLAYDDHRIAQLTWLDAQYGPLALCIIQRPGPVEAAERERRQGMNVVYWSDGEHAFMLIGHNPPAEMDALAAQLRRALAA